MAGLKRSLTKSSDTGSTVKPVGSSGSAVLPTALNVKSVDVADNFKPALNENTLNSKFLLPYQ